MALKDEITAYDTMRADLEMAHLGRWVVVHDCQLVGTYDDFKTAANDAICRFGRGPYLIRQVGRPSVLPLPLSVFRCR